MKLLHCHRHKLILKKKYLQKQVSIEKIEIMHQLIKKLHNAKTVEEEKDERKKNTIYW